MRIAGLPDFQPDPHTGSESVALDASPAAEANRIPLP